MYKNISISAQEWQGVKYSIFTCNLCSNNFYTLPSINAHISDVHSVTLHKPDIEDLKSSITLDTEEYTQRRDLNEF